MVNLIQNRLRPIDEKPEKLYEEINRKLLPVIEENFQRIEISANSLSSPEKLKTWTYTHTITIGEIAAGFFDMTISAITQTKIRGIIVGLWNITTGQARYNTSIPAYAYITTTTNIKVHCAGATVNDISFISIIEAI